MDAWQIGIIVVVGALVVYVAMIVAPRRKRDTLKRLDVDKEKAAALTMLKGAKDRAELQNEENANDIAQNLAGKSDTDLANEFELWNETQRSTAPKSTRGPK